MEFKGKKREFPIEQYKIEKPLGCGGQGIVLQYSRIDSLQVHLPESVAVKNIPESKAKWSRELDIMSLVVANPHPNLVKCYGFCQVQEGTIGIVMKLYDTDLYQYLSKRTSPLTVKETKGIFHQLVAALNHLKKYDIVHRDIKPENILVKVHQNGVIHVTLTDLGISKRMTKTQKSNQSNVGTDMWMAPEIKDLDEDSRSKYGHPADVYGLGLTAIFALTKERPRKRYVKPDDLSKWVNNCLKDVGPNDIQFNNLIERCLKFKPEERIRKEELMDPKFYKDEEVRTADPEPAYSFPGLQQLDISESETECVRSLTGEYNGEVKNAYNMNNKRKNIRQCWKNISRRKKFGIIIGSIIAIIGVSVGISLFSAKTGILACLRFTSIQVKTRKFHTIQIQS